MVKRLTTLASLILILLATGGAGLPKENQNLELQVQVLLSLNDLQLTADQLHALEKLASQTAPAKAPGHPPPPQEYRQALVAYRDALLAGDADKISDAEDKVDDLREKLSITPNLDLDLSADARKHGPEALKLLTSSQVAAYLSGHADDVPDAYATLTDALDQIAGKSDADYKSIRDEAAEQVALLVAGLDSAAQAPVIAKVDDLLDQAHKLSDVDLKAKRSSLEQSARSIVGNVDAIDALRHWMEREMADLLANPELSVVMAEKNK